MLGEILYKKVCLSNKRWDEAISDPEILRGWKKWLIGLSECTTVRVPQSVVDHDVRRLKLHGFSDTSKVAVSAAVYVVAHNAEKPIKQTLLVSKSRVALKNQNISRLELVAGKTLTKLMAHVKGTLQEQAEFHRWIDYVFTDWKKGFNFDWQAKWFERNKITPGRMCRGKVVFLIKNNSCIKSPFFTTFFALVNENLVSKNRLSTQICKQ